MRGVTRIGIWSSGMMLATATAALACPNCYGDVEKTVLDTYYFSTLMLSLLPFGLVAAIVGVGWALSNPTDPDEQGD